MNEMVFLGGRPVSLGLSDGDVGDLLAYRREWEPFIAGHLDLWRHINAVLEDTQIGQERCPPGIFDPKQLGGDNPAVSALCADLLISRIRTSSTNFGGILAQWNVWKDKSSAEILSGAKSMLAFHQEVVLRVGGPMKDDLVRIAKFWNIEIKLPDLPDFGLQQDIISRIQGAFITTKGLLQIVGYAAGDTLSLVGDTGEAVAKGLSDTAKAIPKAVSNPLTWIGIAAVVAVAGGALIVHYLPRPRERAA